jgi:putative SOS response-associated peptidase YedK
MCNRFKRDKPRLREPKLFTLGSLFDPKSYAADKSGRGLDVFPDRMAPVVRAVDGGYEEVEMRWGFPPPPKLGTRPVTNVRNTASSYWRPWLKPEHRCLVPATSFAEWTDKAPKRERWFALPDGRPFVFAGIWRQWTGTRGTKAAPVEGQHLLFSFLTTEPNGVVRPVHTKAMPVILTTAEDAETWLKAPTDVALTLQRPLPEADLRVLDAA